MAQQFRSSNGTTFEHGDIEIPERDVGTILCCAKLHACRRCKRRTVAGFLKFPYRELTLECGKCRKDWTLTGERDG
jgi:hypothetical protein